MQMLNSRLENLPPHLLGLPQGFPLNAGAGPGFGVPPTGKQPHQGLFMYGRESPMGLHSTVNVQPPPALNKQKMDISYLGQTKGGITLLQLCRKSHNICKTFLYDEAVIGTSGANISYPRWASGAHPLQYGKQRVYQVE